MKKKIVEIYDYHNADGELISQTIRFDPKSFSQRRLLNGHFVWGFHAGWYEQRSQNSDYYSIKNAPLNHNQPPHSQAIWLDKFNPVLYRLPKIVQAIKKKDIVIIAEGERDSDNVYSFGFVATTAPMGAGKWQKEFTESLKGLQNAVIIGDKDEVGRRHSEIVAQELFSIGINLKLVEMPNRNGTIIKDFSDWFETGGTKEEFCEIIKQCPDWQPNHLSNHTNNFHNEVIEKFGQPYYFGKGGKVNSLNESFWAGLHFAEHIELFEPVERIFYRYNKQTGTFCEISEHTIKQELSSRILKVSREHNLPSLEQRRKNSVLNNVISHLKGIAEERDAFLKTTNYVHLGNGIIQFDDKGKADFVEFSPLFRSRNPSPIIFNPNAKCEQFINELLLPSVSKDDALLIQKYTGLCLLGNNLIQRFLILDGMAGRGKSSLSLIIQRLIGLNNVTELRTKHLAERFELYRYLKKTLLVGVDVPGKFLSTKGAYVIKALVGNDWFDAEQKCGTGSFQIQGNYCIIITSNSRLQVHLDGDIGAWKRRLLIVRFEGPPPLKKIPNFANYLIEKEGSGILNWALQGLAMLLDDIKTYGDIMLEDNQNSIVDALLAESDSLRHFLIDRVINDDYSDLSVQEIIEQYAEYCPLKGWNAKPITIIQRELETLMLELFSTSKANSIKREGKQVKGFRRVRFKNLENDVWE